MTKVIEFPIGIINAEGVGPEIMDAALQCLHEIERLKNIRFSFIQYQGSAPAMEYSEKAYSELKAFYEEIKAKKGCILRAAIFARLVYLLRAEFNLVCKPMFFEPIPELLEESLLRKEIAKDLNVLLIRENAQGLLFSKEKIGGKKGRQIFSGTFNYEEQKIQALINFAFEQAQQRKKKLHLFIKGDVWQKLAPLWFEAANQTSQKYLEVVFEWDHADTGFADLLHHPTKYDVVVALGIAGDLIADPLATLLYGTHAVIPSANISPEGFVAFQTVHGTAHAIAGQNKANPIGMIRAAAMMLKLFFKMENESALIEKAVRKVLAQGYRTIDMYNSKLEHKLVGTKEMANLVAQEIRKSI